MPFMIISKNNRGFTLMELLIVIGIILLLSGIVLLAVNPAERMERARDNQREIHLESILAAIEQRRAEEGWPDEGECALPQEVVGGEPEEGYEFDQWTGDTENIANTNSESTTITMEGDYEIIANFSLKEHTLDLSSTSGGSVTDPGEGVHTYDYGTEVTLTASPDAEYEFTGWTGDTENIVNTNSESTTITMEGDYEIIANFNPDCEPQDYQACYEGNVYWYDSCDNKGDLVEECGSDSCGSWGSTYCSGGDVYRDRTCYERGCSGGSCYENSYTDTQLVENCSYCCSGGSCTGVCNPGNTTSCSDSCTEKYCDGYECKTRTVTDSGTRTCTSNCTWGSCDASASCSNECSVDNDCGSYDCCDDDCDCKDDVKKEGICCRSDGYAYTTVTYDRHYCEGEHPDDPDCKVTEGLCSSTRNTSHDDHCLAGETFCMEGDCCNCN